MIESAQQAKTALHNLTESLWVFSALTALMESGVLAALQEQRSLDELQQISNLPREVLNQTLRLLIESGFIIFDEKFQLTQGMQELGIEKISAQLRIAFGINNEFIKSARNKNLKVGWNYTDETILQSQGIYSEYIVTDCLPQDKAISQLLSQPGSQFLDIGAGVGKISLCVCKHYPNAHVVALEPADAPFSLASQNISASPYAERIDLRKIYLQDLKDINRYDVIWFPQAFFPNEILETCLTKIWDALKPGGKLITSAISADNKNETFYIRQLINSLYGGFRSAEELIEALTKTGFQEIKVFSEIAGYKTITTTK